MKVNQLNIARGGGGAARLLILVLAGLICSGSMMSALAQSGVAQQQAQTGITTFYYAHKSNAVGKFNAERKRGKYARMYYSDERRQWAVDVSNGLTSSSSSGGGSPVYAQRPPSVADEQKRTGITTFYYAHKSNAVGKLNAEQMRGKYARMYYSGERRQWAVDVGNGLAGTTRPAAAPVPGEPTASSPRAGTNTYYYDYKSNAEGKLKAERSRGKSARMFYDSGRRRWAVEVGNGLTTGGGTGEGRDVTTSASADGGALPSGASIIYFPTKASADGIYKASLRQGDWAKMWYDAQRREWAVAVKPRLRR